MSGENYRSATKSHDPGWNDPPKLNYSPGTGATPPTKLNLNKRVAFPLAATSSQNAPPPAAGGSSSLPQFIPGAPPSGQAGPLPPMAGPPPVTLGTPPKVANFEKVETCSSEDKKEYPSEQEMKECMERTFREFAGKLDSSTQAGVQRRLDLIQQNWNELGEALVRKLFRYAKALECGDSSLAGSIHRAIIVDHGKLSVQWAPALRQLMLTQGPTQQEPVAEGITKPI